MAQISMLCLVVYTIVSAIVGVRLLLRAQRARGVPELLAGLAYVTGPALGYPMAIAGSLIGDRALAVPVYVAGETLLVFGCCCFLFFTMKVFRPGSTWALLAAALGSALLVWSGVAITNAFLSATDPAEITMRARPPLTVMVAVLLISYVWTALEGFRYYRMMRKRMTIGLGDPIVMNRFLLWTFAGLTSTAWISVAVVMLAIGENLARNPINVFATSTGGVVNTVLLVLIFMPPAAYTRWVERSARAGALATA